MTAMPGTPDWLKEKIRAYYDATTTQSYLSTWGKQSLSFHFGLADDKTASLEEAHDNVNAFLADKARIGPKTRVLDAGCGVGGSSLWLAAHRGAEVVGISIVEQQVELATQFAAERGLADRATFRLADMVDTGFDEGEFDVVWNLESLCHVVSPDDYLRHVMHLLRDGGRFVSVDLLRAARTAGSEYERDVCAGWMMPPMRTLVEMKEATERAGFEDVEAIDLTSRSMLPAQALKAMANNSKLLIRAEKAMLNEERPLYEGHVNAAYAYAVGMEQGALEIGYYGGVRPAR